MASLVSPESSSPPLYKVGTPVNEFNPHVCHSVERCPLCNQKTKAFYCKDCVRNGNVYHSRMKLPERYADKQVRYTRLKMELKEQEEQLRQLHAYKTKHLLLKEKISEAKDRVELISRLVDEHKKKLEAVRKAATEIGNGNAQRNLRLPSFAQKMVKMVKLLDEHRQKVEEKREKLAQCEAQLKGVVRGNIRQLTTLIFPISKVDPAPSTVSNVSEDDQAEIDTATAIAEASQTTYVRGRWVYTDTSHETRYRIVEPILPGSGDYTAHYLLSIPSIPVPSRDGDTEDGGGGEGGRSRAVERRTSGAEKLGGAVSVCAGLTYLTQLVNAMAFFLDVTLPKKLCYSEFCRSDLSEDQFVRAVCRLNTNVLYLCLSQNVPPSVLRPTHTTPNLLALLDTQLSDLGRLGSFEIAESLVESMEEGMAEEDPGESSDSEDEDDTDTLSAEWETVPNLPQLEPPTLPTHQAYSTFNPAAVHSQAPGGGQGGAGGIMSSAAASVMSLFRGLGGGGGTNPK